MKKILLAIAIIMTIGLKANAQTDNFIMGNIDGDLYRDDITWIIPILPGNNIGSWDYDQSALPLSDGLLVLTILGAGYAVKKFRNGRE